MPLVIVSATVSGVFGGTAGAIEGALIASAAGFSLQPLHIYAPLFYTGASAYLVAWLLICILAPRLRKAEMAA